MNIAIDIDGTIDKFPALYALLKPGNTIVFLTTERMTREQRAEQLQELGIKRGYTIEIVTGSRPDWIGYNKAMYCKENSIDLMIENSQVNASYVKEYSPTTQVLVLY